MKTKENSKTPSPELLLMEACWRATNYLSVGQIYPCDNPLLKRPLTMGVSISIVLESDIGANSSGLEYRELRDGAGPSMLGYSAYWLTDNDNPH